MNEYKSQLPELKFEIPQAQKTFGVPQLNPGNFNPPNIPYNWKSSWEQRKTDLERNYVANKDYKLNTPQSTPVKKQSSLGNQAAAAGLQALSSNIADKMTDGMFGDSYIGQNLANIFSQGVSTAGNTMATNLMKGQALTQGLGKNIGQSVSGAAVGLASNLIGQGINSLGGDSRLSRGIGQGVATGLGTVGGQAVSNLVNGVGFKTSFGGSGLLSKTPAGAINPYALGASVLGTALGAALGPSKEYGGKYGNITQGMDTAYDVISAGVNFIPGIGQGISGIMALNKGLSNLFGSTDGMTVQDAILGSAFMPAPVKWLNMAGASTTSTFNNQSWQNQQKVDSFMGNAFGNLGDKFSKAREEAGKTYGTFSGGAYDEAQRNIMFANDAWSKIMQMADQNEYQNIRSSDMASINNQRYAQNIQGGWSPVYRGRYGMKILNNATNHNIGMRLLSGAALIDNKQMILCSVVD